MPMPVEKMGPHYGVVSLCIIYPVQELAQNIILYTKPSTDVSVKLKPSITIDTQSETTMKQEVTAVTIHT